MTVEVPRQRRGLLPTLVLLFIGYEQGVGQPICTLDVNGIAARPYGAGPTRCQLSKVVMSHAAY